MLLFFIQSLASRCRHLALHAGVWQVWQQLDHSDHQRQACLLQVPSLQDWEKRPVWNGTLPVKTKAIKTFSLNSTLYNMTCWFSFRVFIMLAYCFAMLQNLNYDQGSLESSLTWDILIFIPSHERSWTVWWWGWNRLESWASEQCYSQAMTLFIIP